MLFIAIRILFAFICAGAFATYVIDPRSPRWIQDHPVTAFVGLMLTSQAATFVDLLFPRKRIEVVTSIYFGMLIGFFLSSLLNQALEPLVFNSPFLSLTFMLTTLLLPYICTSLLLQTKDDFRFIIPYVEFRRDVKGGRPFVLDTSSLIDGRIADMVETRILDSEIVVPNFVLHELQEIADSSEKQRRNRGRRGLDVLSRMQSNPKVDMRFEESIPEELHGLSVDQKLVSLAKSLNGRIVTNDFNLNKVASVQGVDVINLNDVANSLKPRYLPGERLQLRIIKPGESAGQGVGYLDDGTMVVCEGGQSVIGREVTVEVTSMLQNSAGRMIFGRIVTTVSV